MKILGSLIAILILLQIQFTSAQSVGIGTNNPAARLDITRPPGDTPTLNIRGTTNTSHFNIGPGEYTYIRGGRAGSQVLINDYPGSGFIGFGTPSPRTRFHFFNGSSGNSFPNGLMALEGDANTYINILAPNSNETGLLFGKTADAVSGGIVYNNTGTTNGLQFRTNGNINRMVIDGNGNVGIGNNDPAFTLDLSNRMRIRSGGGFSSAGLYLNNINNTVSPAFIGMDDDTHVGFWGSGVGWKFSMNTQTGALKVNGTEGVPGQVITSNGNSQAEWKSPTKAIFDNTVIKIQGPSIDLTPTTPATEIPGLSHTFTAAGNVKILINFHTSGASGFCVGCSSTTFFMDLQLDGAFQARFIENIPNGGRMNYSGQYLIQVGPGSHTIRLVGFSSGSNMTVLGDFYADKSRMILLMIPE